jgi:putative flavoprotein involved in K+ transport
MTKAELVSYLNAYARAYRAPVCSDTTVHAVRACGRGYHVATGRGDWLATVVVVATGECQSAAVPAMARRLSPDVKQITLPEYRNPDALPLGGVLVVGASASGAQLADEILQSGRPVTLAVGRHTRMPRRYRGRDIMAWMDVAGIWDERAESVPDLERARCQPSLQLVGSRDGHSVDLPTLQQKGVQLVGRLTEIEDRALHFADDLARTSANADQKLARLLARIDDFIDANGLDGQAGAPERIAPAGFEAPRLQLDTAAAGIRTVLWATGYRRSYPWLDVPALDDRGELAHEGGVTALPGLYGLGLRFMRRRKSNFIDGVGRDAGELADHIAGYLKLGRGLAA